MTDRRLTDEELADILRDNTRIPCGDNAYALAWEARSMAEELTARRVADLSDAEREALRWLRAEIQCSDTACDRHPRMIALLDRLGGKP